MNDWAKNFTFDEKNHVYTLDGKPITGVTTILGQVKQIPLQWPANEVVKFIKENCDTFDEKYLVTESELEQARLAHKSKSETSASFGTNVHQAIEMWIKNDKSINEKQLSDTEKVAFDKFVYWAEKNKVEFLESELRIYSRTHWFAGTCDLVMRINGKIWIGDIKTTSGIYPEFFWQTSAYQLAMQELGLYTDVEGHVIINVKKDGRMEVERSYGYERNKTAFLAALTIYRVREALKREMK